MDFNLDIIFIIIANINANGTPPINEMLPFLIILKIRLNIFWSLSVNIIIVWILLSLPTFEWVEYYCEVPWILLWALLFVHMEALYKQLTLMEGIKIFFSEKVTLKEIFDYMILWVTKIWTTFHYPSPYPM